MGIGHSRVTHPSAARLGSEDPASLDLHVLGTPPAFVLSQDQTLQESLTLLLNTNESCSESAFDPSLRGEAKLPARAARTTEPTLSRISGATAVAPIARSKPSKHYKMRGLFGSVKGPRTRTHTQSTSCEGPTRASTGRIAMSPCDSIPHSTRSTGFSPAPGTSHGNLPQPMRPEGIEPSTLGLRVPCSAS